jgi:hypothetical protein
MPGLYGIMYANVRQPVADLLTNPYASRAQIGMGGGGGLGQIVESGTFVTASSIPSIAYRLVIPFLSTVALPEHSSIGKKYQTTTFEHMWQAEFALYAIVLQS